MKTKGQSNKVTRSSEGLFDPKIDFVFKSIFGKEKDLFCSFANSVIQPPKNQEIVDIEFINSELPKENMEEKLSRLDVLAKLQNGSFINIEVQLKNSEPFQERVIYYWSKLYTSQLKPGDYYDKLKKVICINLVNFIMFEDNVNFHNVFEIVNRKTKQKMSDVFEVHFLETQKFKDSHKTMLDKWMLFLRDPLSVSKLNEQNHVFIKAKECLVILSQDENARRLYEARMDRIRLDYGSLKLAKNEGFEEGMSKGIEEGMSKGILEEKIVVVTNMKSLGMDLETISKVTGLAVTEIKKMI